MCYGNAKNRHLKKKKASYKKKIKKNDPFVFTVVDSSLDDL